MTLLKRKEKRESLWHINFCKIYLQSVKVAIGVRLFHIITLLTLVVFVPHIIDITFIVTFFFTKIMKNLCL